VGVVGFEAAIQGSLESLLAGEPGLSVLRFPKNWSPGSPLLETSAPPGGESGEDSPDVLIMAPPSCDWVNRVHAQFPRACLLAMVDWHRREQFSGAPICDYFERFESYHGLLELLRQHDAK
jgi:hypothetical protein